MLRTRRNYATHTHMGRRQPEGRGRGAPRRAAAAQQATTTRCHPHRRRREQPREPWDRQEWETCAMVRVYKIPSFARQDTCMP